jgi:hypothetical protein
MSNDTLRIALQAAVPLHIHKIREWTFKQRGDAAAECSQVIAEHGDDLMYGGKHCVDAFNKLALGLACSAYQPGGVTFLGDHWEVSDSAHDYEFELEMRHDAEDDEAAGV